MRGGGQRGRGQRAWPEGGQRGWPKGTEAVRGGRRARGDAGQRGRRRFGVACDMVASQAGGQRGRRGFGVAGDMGASQAGKALTACK